MIHKCSACSQRYLVSDYYALCNWCGSERQKQIERASESDGAVEWWIEVSRMAHGEPREVRRRWEIC